MSLSKRSRALQSTKFIEKRRKKRIGAIVISVLLVLGIGIGGVLVARIPFIQIKEIEVSGTSRASHEKVQAVIKEKLIGTYFSLIPRTNILFFPKEESEVALKKEFKDIENISIKRKGFSKINVELGGMIAAALVCEGFHQDEIEEMANCFYADKAGYVFSRVSTSTSFSVPVASSSPEFRYYIVSDKGEGIIGTNFIEREKFTEMMSFVEGARQAGIPPLGILIAENGQYEMYVKNPRSRSSTTPEITIYFDQRVPLKDTLSNFVAFWGNTFSSGSSGAAKATTTGTIDYINLRYGNNIFYSNSH